MKLLNKKLSITKTVGFLLLVPTLGSLIILVLFHSFLTRTDQNVQFTNLAGRQRMLAERLNHYITQIMENDQIEDREALKEYITIFDQSLEVLERGGEIGTITLVPPPSALNIVLDSVIKIWQELKPQLLVIADQSISDPRTIEAYNYVRSSLPLLLEKSNKVVSEFSEWDQNLRDRMFYIIATLVSISSVMFIAGIWVTRRYIVEQKQIEQVLREDEQKFRGVIENSGDGLFVLKNGHFVFINPRFTEITGYSLQDIQENGFNFNKLAAEEELRVFEEWVTERRRGKDVSSRMAFKARRKDGQLRDLEVSVTTVDWEGIPAILGVIYDVTERNRDRKVLEQALEKAREGERVKSLFLANMSHEIRTPLNSILGFTELLEQSVGHLVNPEEKIFFETIQNSSERLMKTVHEILDLSQIEVGTMEISADTVDLIALTKNIINETLSLARAKNLKLTFHADCTEGFVIVDEYCLKQALVNIIDNAIKYTEQGEVDVTVTQADDHYILSVVDTGIGMSPEFQERMFDAFTQESEGYTKRFQGIGLGLALTKRYLDLNQIPFEVKSKLGEGTTFILKFPAAEKPRLVAHESRSEDHSLPPHIETARKPLVLVVEDNIGSQILMKHFLKDHCETCFATSVQEARKLLESQSVALMLVDLSLEGDEDGLDLVRFCRSTEKWKDIPIIATTAHAFTQDRDNCLAAGCNDYLAKPIMRDGLLTVIHQYLS
jgi:PAS domain S-box-containing protein